MNENKNEGIVAGAIEVAGDIIEGAVDVVKAGLDGGIGAVHDKIVDNVVDYVGDGVDSREFKIDCDLKDLMDGDLFVNVRVWAINRNIVAGSAAKDQYLKLMSEFGELARAIKNSDDVEVVDGIGDCLVVLIIIAAQLGLDLELCIGLRVADEDLYAKDHQILTLADELGELSDSISKNDVVNQEANIGGAIIVLAAMAKESQAGTVEACLTAAYNDIKNRKGVMYNGVFIKESDPRFAGVMEEFHLQKQNGGVKCS